MFRNYRKSTYTGGARLTALLLVVLAVWGLTSCQPGKIPPDTTDGTGIDTTVPPVTDDPVQEEVKLVNTVFTSALLKGDIPGPFEDLGETVYITMGVPEGMGGGYSLSFGLIQVRYDKPEKTRTPKKSYHYYKKVIENCAVE